MSGPREISIVETSEQLAAAAAELVRAAAAAAIRARGRFLLTLAGGATPDRLYRRLVDGAQADLFEWARVVLLWGDERAVPPEADGSNYGRAMGIFGSLVPPENVVRMRGELTPPAAAADYAAQLAQLAADGRRWPRLDLVILGLGSDGHTASLFPGPIAAAEASAATLAVTADYEDRPVDRVTLTPAVINDARQILFLVAGQAKAQAVAALLSGNPDPERWPAARIQPADGVVTWLLDRPAAARLGVGGGQAPDAS